MSVLKREGAVADVVYMERSEMQQEWMTYPAFSDGNQAMFLYNHALVRSAPMPDAPELYAVRVEMNDPGERGLGSDTEAMWFFNFEDGVCEAAEQMNFIHVGRVRSAGQWELAFYGAAGRNFAEVLDAVGPFGPDREISITGMDDPEWSYLLGYMAADAERWQWMMDYRVVTQLSEAGDNLEVPRPVDHSANFPTADARAGFIAAVEQLGFDVTSMEDRAADSWSVHLQREDQVMIGAIHDTVMDVVDLVDRFGGTYDGWGCPIAS